MDLRPWKITATIAALIGWALPAIADPNGTYSLTGTNPHGGTYHGEITIEPVGAIYDLTWRIERDTFTGIGIVEGETLSAAYGSDTSVSGVIQMNRTEAGWEGTWAYVGETGLGRETWNAQPTPVVANQQASPESGASAAIWERFIAEAGYEVQDVTVLNDLIERQLTPSNPNSVFLPSGALNPFVKGILTLEAADNVLERVRYRVTYAQEMVDAPPAASPVPVSLVQIDRFNLGPVIRDALVQDIGAENVAPPADFGVGPHVSWRLATRSLQGHKADILAASRSEILDSEAQARMCFTSNCLVLGSVIEDAVPSWDGTTAPHPDAGRPYPTQRDGLLTPAAAIDSLTRDFSYEPREGSHAPSPFVEIIIEQNLGQDTNLDAAIREGAMMDDSVGAIWQRLSAFSAGAGSAPSLSAARAFECRRGPDFAAPGTYCP
ncbi:hypothetical protein [Pontibaca salina]|uniref:Uncharacterized protein n=1 Tax=Pontibaca salina TaxID=2795731 RepID=A0A934M2F1_9RHOB|nr:hypothetical protein [Pontibaca salina]MBI6628754.1 hypothetical protein [Pontibaca salina]